MTHSIHYAQLRDGSWPGQSSIDVLTWPTTPAAIKDGAFTIWLRPQENSAYASKRVLIHAALVGENLTFEISTTGTIEVRSNGTLLAETPAITFSADQEMAIVFDSDGGSISVVGATTGDGTFYGVPWTTASADGPVRLGGTYGGADKMLGYLSLPYRVVGSANSAEVALLSDIEAVISDAETMMSA